MWETIRAVLTSSNAASILLFLVFLAILVAILIRTGLLTINTGIVQFGVADRERNILRQQMEWIRLHLIGFEASMEKPKGYNVYLGKYIVEKIYDQYVDWLTLNHLSKSECYIKMKQDAIVNIVRELVVKEEYKTKEFEDFIREDTKESILALLEIRNNFNK